MKKLLQMLKILTKKKLKTKEREDPGFALKPVATMWLPANGGRTLYTTKDKKERGEITSLSNNDSSEEDGNDEGRAYSTTTHKVQQPEKRNNELEDLILPVNLKRKGT